MMHTHHRAHLVHPVAAGIHHDIAIDVAMFGVNGPGVVLVLGQRGYRCVTIDFGSSSAGATRQRLAKLRGVDIAIERIP